MRILAVSVAFALCGCHLIYPFTSGEVTDAGPGDSSVVEAGSGDDGPAGTTEAGPAEAGPADQGGENDAGSADRVVWVKTFGSAATEMIHDVAVAASGAIHLVGNFSGTDLIIDSCKVNASNSSAQVLVVTLGASSTCAWARAYGGKSEDNGLTVDVDSAGSVFIAGTYREALDMQIGGQAPFSSVTQDSFVARLDANGTAKAAIALSGAGDDNVQDLVIDGGGLVAVTGWFNSAKLWLDGSTKLDMPSSAKEAGFFARYDTGLKAAVYGEIIAGSGHLRSKAVATNGTDEIYVAGYYSGTVDLDGDTLSSTGGGTKESFIAAFETKNAVHWAYNVGNISYWDQFRGVTGIPGRKLLAAVGYFRIQGSYGGHKAKSAGGDEAVVALFDTRDSSSGGEVFVGAQRLGGLKNDQAVAVAADAQGNIYVAGYYQEAADVGGTKLGANNASQDIFVASFTDKGVHRWSASFGGAKTDAPTAIAVRGGFVYVTGFFEDQATFGPFSPPASSGKTDVFVLKLKAGP